MRKIPLEKPELEQDDKKFWKQETLVIKNPQNIKWLLNIIDGK